MFSAGLKFTIICWVLGANQTMSRQTRIQLIAPFLMRACVLLKCTPCWVNHSPNTPHLGNQESGNAKPFIPAMDLSMAVAVLMLSDLNTTQATTTARKVINTDIACKSFDGG